MKGCVPGFNGERQDPVSGTIHLGNGYRAYAPLLMRFHCPDSWSPFGNGGINPYAYGDGDPVNQADPSGHLSWQSWLGIGMGLVGLVGLGMAVCTCGASIAAAGGMMASIESASVLSLIAGGLSMVSDVAGIASGVSADSHPEASSLLGWISLGTGAAGLAHGLWSMGGAWRSLSRSPATIISWGGDERKIMPLTFGQGSLYGAAVNSVTHVFEDTYRGARRLNIVAHGSFNQRNGIVRVRVFASLEHANKVDGGLAEERLTGGDFAKMLRELDVHFGDYQYARTLVCNSANGCANSFAAAFSAESGLPTKGFRGLVSTKSQLQRLADRTIENNLYNQTGALNVQQINSRLSRLAERGREIFTVMKPEHGYGYDPVKFGYPD